MFWVWSILRSLWLSYSGLIGRDVAFELLGVIFIWYCYNIIMQWLFAFFFFLGGGGVCFFIFNFILLCLEWHTAYLSTATLFRAVNEIILIRYERDFVLICFVVVISCSSLTGTGAINDTDKSLVKSPVPNHNNIHQRARFVAYLLKCIVTKVASAIHYHGYVVLLKDAMLRNRG